MNDEQLEQALRATFAGHAEAVTHGPAWDPAEEPLDTDRGRSRSRARRLAPLAAAAAVLAVVGGVFALRGDDHASRTAPAGQLSIPKGMQAVDALGLEIFVPKSFVVDDACQGGPAVVLPIPASVGSCPAMLQADQAVTIAAAPATTGMTVACTDPIRLDGEPGCVMRSSAAGAPGRTGPESASVSWPRHDVSLTVANLPEALTLQILRSAHAVPIDRNGCAARDDRLSLPPTTSIKNIPDPADVKFDSALLPVPKPQGLSVCWYIDNRLAASALLDQKAAQRVLGVANGMPPKWPAPQPQPTLPSCDDVATHDGVLLTAHTAGRPDVSAVADFAACNGQRTSRSATAAYLTTAELADALATASGIPISLGYATTR